MSFFSIRDQQVPVRLLRNMLSRNRVPHGLLLQGPSGVGKHLTAFQFAKAVNCLEKNNDACDTCLSCRKIEHGNHPDIKEITPSGKTRIINMEAISFINDLSAYRAFEGRRRVFLINEAERMRPEAQNHFLKMLEEPPSATVFILMTEFPRRLLPTIRSRCQQVRFGALRPETVSELLLRDRDLPPEVARAIAAISQGQMSRAIDLVETEKRDVVLSAVQRLAQREDPLSVSEDFAAHLKSREEAIAASLKDKFEIPDKKEATKEEIDEAKEELAALVAGEIRSEVMEYLYLFATWYRDELAVTAGGDEVITLNRDQVDRMRPADTGQLAKKIAAIDQAWLYVERNLFKERIFRDLFFKLGA